jgi:hypothetical protein
LDVAVTGMAVGDRLERRDPVVAGLADADQDAGGERDLGLAASRRVSIIIPWLGDTARSSRSSSAGSAPAFACGSRPVSVSTSCAMSWR